MLNKPMLVLLPGTDGTGLCYKELQKLLSPQYECLVIPLPITGPQDYETLASKIIQQVPANRDYALICESFSSPMALLIATQAPNRPTKMIIATGFARSPYPWAKPFIPVLKQLFIKLKIPKFFISFFLLNDAHKSLTNDLTEILKSVPADIIFDRVKTVLECDLGMRLPEITVPTLYLC